jgi:hypothetical protein
MGGLVIQATLLAGSLQECRLSSSAMSAGLPASRTASQTVEG